MPRFYKTAVQGNAGLCGRVVRAIEGDVVREVADTVFIRGRALHGIPGEGDGGACGIGAVRHGSGDGGVGKVLLLDHRRRCAEQRVKFGGIHIVDVRLELVKAHITRVVRISIGIVCLLHILPVICG